MCAGLQGRELTHKKKNPSIATGVFRTPCSAWIEIPAKPKQSVLAELVHGVVFAAGFQGCFTSEVLFVSIANVGAGHVLVLNAGDTLTDLLTLNAFHVGQHAFFCEVPFGQVVGGQRSGVVGRQGDQVVEDTSLSRSVALEGADHFVSTSSQVSCVVVNAHQLGAVVGRNVLTFANHDVEHLLTEVQSPVERWAVVVNQLGVRDGFTDFVNHASDLTNVRLLGFDPQHVSAVLQRSDAVQYAACFTGASAELEQVGRQTLRTQQLAATVQNYVAVVQVGSRNFFAIQEGVVLVAQVARLVGNSDLLGQASTQGVGTCNDNAVVDAQLEECVANSVDLGQEVGVSNGHFTVLVAALLLIGNLVFDLDAASTRFDHFLSQQVGGFWVTETSVDVGNDRYNVSFVAVDLSLDFVCFYFVASSASSVQSGEQQVQLTGVSLAQEGVQLFDQAGNRGFLVHGLIRQRTEIPTQSSNHPTRQEEVARGGGLQVLLDRNQLLLTDETMPAAQGLGVDGGVSIVLSHVFAHDVGSVLSDFQTGFETVLGAHAGHGLRVNSAPTAACGGFKGGYGFDVVLIS